LILLTPWRIPQLARAVRESITEFRKASGTKPELKAERKVITSRLKQVAKELGVETKGKKATQILKEIEEALKKSR
jgi:Sec-independent protein translocase protein TatA